MPISDAKRKAIAKYDKESVERTTVRLKKGTKARMKAIGVESINGYITDAIEEKLKKDELYYNECLESHLKALEEMDAMTDEEVRKILEDEDL